MYPAYQAQSDLMWPLPTAARLVVPMFQDSSFGMAPTRPMRGVVAACKVLELAQVTHSRPPWNIDAVVVKGEAVPVTEEAVFSTPFATLMRFRKDAANLLVVCQSRVAALAAVALM